MPIKYDRIFYFKGSKEAGQWHSCPVEATSSVKAQVQELRRMGYYAVEGLSTIGAPDGNPIAEGRWNIDYNQL